MKRVFSVFLIVGIFLQGCATVRLPELSVRSPSQYRLSQAKEGLVMSVEPHDQTEKIKEVFVIDLLSNGIFPVFVVVQNNSTDSNYYLRKEKSGLLMATGNDRQEGSKASSLFQEEPEDNKVKGVIVGGAIILSPVVCSLIFGFGGTAHNNQRAIERNLLEKELKDKSIGPGESQHGFFYFKIPEGKSIEDIGFIKIEVTDLTKQNTLSFSFPLN